MSINDFSESGTKSSWKIADTGHTASQAPQSMQVSGSMKNWSPPSWIASTGQVSTQSPAFSLMQGDVITNAK